jgi:phage gpG-like protein
MLKMHIELTGVKEFEGNLDRIHGVIQSFEPELRDIGEWYIGFLTNDVFETEGGVYHDYWASLTPAYAASKSKENPGRGVLEASGFMRTHWKLYTTSHYALIENEADYAIYHQEGTSKIPQRMFVKFDQDRQNTILEMFKEGILRRIQQAVR